MVERNVRSVADLAEGTIVATVEIEAPPERVYRALASEEVVKWWGAEGLYQTTEWTGEVKPGGKWRAAGQGADGKPFSVGGEYLETDPPRKLVYTWSPDWDPGKPTVVTYRLEAIEGGTRVTLRHTGFTSQQSCAGHADGWMRVLAWLRGHAAPKAPHAFYLIRLLPPRPTFIADMTENERRVMGEHVVYWRKLLGEGIAVAFGPVADPKGAWGVGIVEVESDATLKRMEAEDPAITSGIGLRYEILPMVQAVVRS
jgi:uncharacterized protein YndB with AHSA1/START domain